ncbi:autoinducer binding domain-containing protein [Pseudomonas alkylphenolica]|uniref:autoinducer binding domain-containing protein n=1 Tax=Pseudomonas alkylphenolica TaxID=237609 RepID=UPI000FA6D30D
MPHWKEEQLQQLLSETDEQRMSGLAASLAEELGMERISFSALTPIANARQPLRTFNNYPPAWNERYQHCNYFDIDPVVRHCHTSLLPILWDKEVFRETPKLWKEAQLHGLCYGWSLSAHDQYHNECMLSVVRSHTPVTPDEFIKTAGQTLFLCNLMHTLIFKQPSAKPSSSFHLSARETEVLKWSAAGKTAADISYILTLSQSTVNFHIRSIITKLNCSNKTGAIAVAVRNGLLG